jgi:hypothetical protein
VGNISCGATVRRWRRRQSAPLWNPTKVGGESTQDTVTMSALGVIQISLCVSSLAAAVIFLPVRYQIYRHLRRHHRKAFDQFGIRSPSFLWREDRDAESTAFEDFFSSGNHETLKDPRLNALLRLESSLSRACGLSFALLLITFLVFQADAAHIWDFLVDLGHY